jgi:hypothetical protein
MQRNRRRKPANDTESQSITLWREARPSRAMTLLYGSGYDRDARHEFLTAVAGVSPSDATDFATDRYVTYLWPDVDQECDPQWTTRSVERGATWPPGDTRPIQR